MRNVGIFLALYSVCTFAIIDGMGFAASFLLPLTQSTLLRAMVCGFVYFLGAETGHFFSAVADDVAFATFWPPAGLLLSFLTLSSRRDWPGILVCVAVANLASDVWIHAKPLEASLGFCVANITEGLLGAYLLRRWHGTRFRLIRIADVFAFATLAAGISAMVGATIGTLVVVTVFAESSFWVTWQTWWFADAIGILVVAPVVFAVVRDLPLVARTVRGRKLAEGIVVLSGMAIVAEGVFGGLFPAAIRVPILILPFLLWSAFRFGIPGSSIAILVAGLIGIWNASQGRGPFAHLPSPRMQMLRSQGTLGVISLSVLVLAATVAERKRIERSRIALIGELEKALHEIKTLRGLIRMCAWCNKIRDDDGEWRRLEEYISSHTDAEFTHGMCPKCLNLQLEAIKPPKGESKTG